MKIDVLTIFPEMFTGPMDASIIGRAREKGILSVTAHDVRAYTTNKHRRVDDTPFGGGAGMVMNAQPFFDALAAICGPPEQRDPARTRVALLTPQGAVFSQAKARELSALKQMVLICGRYEGIDDRVRQAWVDEEISIGDYVLTGGELPAMVVIDAVARLLPGALGDATSAEEESFSDGLLEYPQYTKPALFRGMEAPAELLSGHHEAIRRWRRKEAFKRTYQNRPELLMGRPLSVDDQVLLAEALGELGLDVAIPEKPKKKRARGREPRT
ncbi:tRNA (guanosine(37)-N1)-methyltransferase TrmD [Heliobacterium gestii]|uniref:tRNA (guanine-N(1)-)-methyltransferase n=1 Tax=Heliomicrobium gestii TaxID=2699 RepID=A0A845LDS6_HELGE|nr:tRNA (guanosine(37)-N1)-methyltransferase TrmD [Heliomicrobium gestii]MBM7867061.1 tRNA (guanine37-N1)-methyltransferase [Heliomicrobium gestii]MZP43524.1 tRNA (guanosine(37)-N1)-methyltransferase TrmD [Heliomicrobium gestii]